MLIFVSRTMYIYKACVYAYFCIIYAFKQSHMHIKKLKGWFKLQNFPKNRHNCIKWTHDININSNNFLTDRLWKQIKCAHLLPSSVIFVSMCMHDWTFYYAYVFRAGMIFHNDSVKSFRLYRYTYRKRVKDQGLTKLISVWASLIRAIFMASYKIKKVCQLFMPWQFLYLTPRAVFIFMGKM